MSSFPDYEGEMDNSTLSDREAELLLSGTGPLTEGAAQLVVFVDLIRAEGARVPSEETVARVASEAAEIARSTVPEKQAAARPRRQLAGWRWRPQFGVAAATVLLLISVTGVAAAADGAAPGDALYGIDRALEKIGIGAGHADERLEEARTLLSNGKATETVRHATEVLDAKGQSEGADLEDARTALEDAASNLEDDDAPGNVAVQEDVSELLRYLQENLGNDLGADGREFGQGVADRARDIAPGQPADSNPSQGNSNGNGGSNGGNGNGNGNGGANSGSGGRDGGNAAPGGSGSAPGQQGDS